MQATATPSVSPRTAYAQRGTNTLQHIFRDHFRHFAADYDARHAKELGNFRIERITRVATRFLTCGDYPLSGSGVDSRRESCQGVARMRFSNPTCGHEYFRPFACRGFHPLGGQLHRLCPTGSSSSLSPKLFGSSFATTRAFLLIGCYDDRRRREICR